MPVLVEQVTNLSILPSPPRSSTVAVTEFAFSKGMSAVFDALRPHSDLIVVDAPPLMPLADSHALAEHADCILLAVTWDRTPRDVFAKRLNCSLRSMIGFRRGADTRRSSAPEPYDYYCSSAYMRPYGYGVGAQQEAAE